MEVPEETVQDLPNGPTQSPDPSNSNAPAPRRTRSHSSGGHFPPPMRRTSTDASGAPRPVPFAAKFQRVHPGTTGVTVLEHLERLDAVEASLQRLGVDEDVAEEEEVDVGEVSRKAAAPLPQNRPHTERSSSEGQILSSSSPPPPESPLRTVPEAPSARSSIDEEDLVALSKSTSHVEGAYPFGGQETLSSAGMEWMQSADSPAKRMVISEVRLETFVVPFSLDLKGNLSAVGNCEEQTIMFMLVVMFLYLLEYEYTIEMEQNCINQSPSVRSH